jgi:hypothetical protein
MTSGGRIAVEGAMAALHPSPFGAGDTFLTSTLLQSLAGRGCRRDLKRTSSA